MAGAPKGNTNALGGFKARNALEMAIANKGENKEVISSMQVLYDIWRVQVAKALDGDQAATNSIMDRLDGKPGQSVMLTGDDENPIAIREVQRIIVKPKDTDS